MVLKSERNRSSKPKIPPEPDICSVLAQKLCASKYVRLWYGYGTGSVRRTLNMYAKYNAYFSDFNALLTYRGRLFRRLRLDLLLNIRSR